MKLQDFDTRVWNNRTKQYLNPVIDYLEHNNGLRSIVLSLETIPVEQGLLDETDYELELYIGLKDSNGDKIYEGDIVKAKKRIIDPNYPEEAEPFIAIVKKYHDDSIPLYFMMYKTTNNNDVFDFEYYEVEVIGNIHENEELLQKE